MKALVVIDGIVIGLAAPFLLFGLDMDPETAAVAGGLIGAIASTIIAYVVPAKSGKYVEVDATPVTDDYQPKH